MSYSHFYSTPQDSLPLQEGEPITSLDALERYGCMRLASRISELKRKGFPIRSRFIRTGKGKQVKEYWLDCA